jgi:hypothetical protein
MKRYLLLLICILTAAACATQKKPVIAYEFPENMSPIVQASFTKLCDKGAVLYTKNCSHCHNVKVKGRILIPDFPQEKMLGYAIRLSNRQHEINMPDSIVSAEELALISTFFSYKKKNKTK